MRPGPCATLRMCGMPPSIRFMPPPVFMRRHRHLRFLPEHHVVLEEHRVALGQRQLGDRDDLALDLAGGVGEAELGHVPQPGRLGPAGVGDEVLRVERRAAGGAARPVRSRSGPCTTGTRSDPSGQAFLGRGLRGHSPGRCGHSGECCRVMLAERPGRCYAGYDAGGARGRAALGAELRGRAQAGVAVGAVLLHGRAALGAELRAHRTWLWQLPHAGGRGRRPGPRAAACWRLLGVALARRRRSPGRAAAGWPGPAAGGLHHLVGHAQAGAEEHRGRRAAPPWAMPSPRPAAPRPGPPAGSRRPAGCRRCRRPASSAGRCRRRRG